MSLSIDVDLTEFKAFRKKIVSDVESLTRGAVIAAGIGAVHQAKLGGFKDHTGQLRANISSRYIGQRGAWFTVDVVSSMPYASYVNNGTPPHDIWPKAGHNLKGPVREGQTRRATGKGPHEYIVGGGLALRWRDGSGQQHFARMVHHPGSKPIPFMDQAKAFGQLTFETYFSRGFAGIAAQLE